MAFDKELGYDPKELVNVLIEQTQVETVVNRAYYEKYKVDGVRFLSLVNEPEKPKPAPRTKKVTKEE